MEDRDCLDLKLSSVWGLISLCWNIYSSLVLGCLNNDTVGGVEQRISATRTSAVLLPESVLISIDQSQSRVSRDPTSLCGSLVFGPHNCHQRLFIDCYGYFLIK